MGNGAAPIGKQVSLNLNIRGLGQSPTLEINDESKRLKKEGRTVYQIGRASCRERV